MQARTGGATCIRPGATPSILLSVFDVNAAFGMSDHLTMFPVASPRSHASTIVRLWQALIKHARLHATRGSWLAQSHISEVAMSVTQAAKRVRFNQKFPLFWKEFRDELGEEATDGN